MFLVAATLDQLRSQNISTQGYRFAKNSRKNVVSHIRTWIFFCTFFCFTMLAASDESLCLFAEMLSITCGYPYIKSILGSIKYLHLARGFNYPAESFNLDCTLQGLKRRLARTPNQVLPLDPTILRGMYKFINKEKAEDLSLWCSFLVAFFCLFRKANVVPDGSNYDPRSILTRGDIHVDEANHQVYIYVAFSKTDQFMKRAHTIPIPQNDDEALDLYRHMKKLMTLCPAEENAPAFIYQKNKFITYRTFTSRLKALLAKAGHNPDLFSGHSFRRGGASYLHSIGGTTLLVQTLGNWASQIFIRYLHLSTEDRYQAQILIAEAINASATSLPNNDNLLHG